MMPGTKGARLCGRSSVVSGLRGGKPQDRPTAKLQTVDKKVATTSPIPQSEHVGVQHCYNQRMFYFQSALSPLTPF